MIVSASLLLLLTFSIYVFERWWTGKALRLGGLGLDIFYVFSINFSYYLIFSWLYPYWSQVQIFQLEFSALNFILFLFVSEFLQYASHRIIHSDFLWRYHMVHHSASDLSAMSSFRYHPVVLAFGSSFRGSILFLLGFPPSVFFIGRFLQDLIQIVCHCDFHWRIGPLKYLLVTPQFHRTHHVSGGARCNYGNFLSVYDWIFGTYKEPEAHEVYGVAEMESQSWRDHIKKFFLLDLIEDRLMGKISKKRSNPVI